MISYLETIAKNHELATKLDGTKPYNIGVLSNIIINQLKEPLEYNLRTNNINAHVTFGDYDNIIQDSVRFQSYNALIVFWEACNILEGAHYKTLSMTAGEINDLAAKVKSEIDLVISNLKNVPVVIVNRFSSLLFNYSFLQKNAFDTLLDELNIYLHEKLPKNFVLIDIDKVIARGGIEASFNKRFWYSSKMLYTVYFLQSYAMHTAPVLLSILGKTKKALILDCDNTMWKGIVGEDLVDGIAISANQTQGAYFEEVQYLARALKQKGVVLGINSKNNPGDIAAVFDQRNDMPLNASDFLIKKVNWQDKVSNLKEIAKEINIGIDSLVHVDDSDFEINYIRTNLPSVTAIQVPASLGDYPRIIRENMDLFYTMNLTSEDTQRAKMYQDEQLRESEKNQFESVEDYLKSLNLELKITVNDQEEVGRVAQMTQKTNQFNLTTKRYTENEIAQKLDDGNYFIITFSLTDRFGQYGITGLAIIEKNNTTAVIDTLLMSCRVIGRNIERAFFDFIVRYLMAEGIEELRAEYLKTLKNAQVESLYDSFGMKAQPLNDQQKAYSMLLKDYTFFNVNYITVNHGK